MLGFQISSDILVRGIPKSVWSANPILDLKIGFIRTATMSWAAVARQEPQPAAANETAEATAAQQVSTAVIDANAIIAGMRMDGIAEHLCTIPEVLQEVKDQKSREFLETFPHNIRSSQPTEESVKAGNEHENRLVVDSDIGMAWAETAKHCFHSVVNRQRAGFVTAQASLEKISFFLSDSHSWKGKGVEVDDNRCTQSWLLQGIAASCIPFPQWT